MASSINPIFLKENEKDIFLALENQGINTKVFENKLANLFNRVYNNFVGYYIFKQKDTIYKLIILPKSISINSKTREKYFVNYLLHYHRINNKYLFDETKKIEDSLLSLAFKNNNDENSHLPLEEFEFYKYKSILDAIEKFFKKHKNYKRVKVDYVSQSVKYKLNLQKNIKELDNTKLHQTRTVDMMYSLISTITYGALKLFMSNKLNDFDDEKKKNLLSQCKSINSLIAKKYNLDKSYKLTLSRLNSFKVAKAFKAKNETQELLTRIKSLFGFEQMYDDKDISVNNNYDLATTSFFIDPIKFYEWYVYDILKSYTDKSNKIILFDNQKSETTTKYKLKSIEKDIDIDKRSKPDYVLIDEKEKIKIIIDAKWKNIENLSKVSSSDYLKLQLDSSLLKNDSYNTISYLIYPRIENNTLEILTGDKHYFNFNTLQIDMNFDKEKNKIDFSYDYKKIEEDIRANQKIEKLKSNSEALSNNIKLDRTEIINTLLSQENLENKEEKFLNLDNILINSAKELKESIEDNISDEIKDILDEYRDILEEDSKKFLKSSSSIYNYYKNKNYEHFDYSMPGSGFWKLIELELNTSFSWFLRIKSNICDNSSPWTSISSSRRSITQELDNGKKVRLNQFDHNDNSKLQGLMLGGISLLLQDSSTIADFDELSSLDRNFFVEQLNNFVSNIISIRNEHAHIKAMSLDKFEELYTLLFFKQEGLSNIKKLLECKKEMKEKINDR